MQYCHSQAVLLARRSREDLSKVWLSKDEPVWKWLPWVLAAAWLLRLFVGLSGDYFLRADEISQYLEQAHRLVFGYGYIPWEYDVGARPWLIAALPALVLLVCDALGLGHPDFYIPAVKVFNATLSMTIPFGAYVLCRRLISESAARAACLVCCFWYEFVVFASHVLAETYAAAAFFAAAAFLKNPLGVGRALAAGFLLGLTVALRVPYAVSVAGFGLVLLLLPIRQIERLLLISGGALALLAWGVLDWITLGGVWSSILTYVSEVREPFSKLVQFRGEQVFKYKIELIFWPSLGLMLVGIVWSAWRCCKLLPLSMALLPSLAVHFLPKQIEYTNFYLLVVLAGICMADMHVWLASASFKLFKFRVQPGLLSKISLAALSFASLAGMMPGHKHTTLARSSYLFDANPYLQTYRLLAKLPDDQVASVLFDVQDLVTSTGQYYYLHHDVGVYFPWTYEEHRNLVETIDFRESMSHVITYVPQCFPGFAPIGQFANLWIMENTNLAAAVSPPHPSRVLEFFTIDAELLSYFASNVKPFQKWVGKCSRG
ncbi:MAG: hypothetical protein OXC81_03215 [Betaproteobacteria bacterium]|nr:hypothetical protein [Betaproteobacteria bacterium]